MPTSHPVHRARRALTLIAAFVLSLVALTTGASTASAAPAKLTKVFGGPVTGACTPDAVAANTQASRYQNFCVAFRAENDEGPTGKDLVSQVIDTPKGFAGTADRTTQCSDSDFAVASADNSNCPAASQIGEVGAKIRAQISQTAANNGLVTTGLGNQYLGNRIVQLTPTGVVYNLEHSENEVARLGIDLRPSASIQLIGFPVAPIDQPNVKIIVRVTLRPSPDVGLRSIIETLPTTADVKFGGFSPDEQDDPLAVDEFSLTFFGPPQGGMTVPFAFLGSDCSNTQATQIRARDELGGTSTADSVTYKLTDCDDPNIPFLPSVSFSTSENRPDVTTETAVSVKFGNSTNAQYQAAGPKRTVVILPDGLSFSGQIASGANGLPLCTPAQFGKNQGEPSNCPAATAVGTVSFKSPVQTRLLTGKVFLGSQPAPGELPDIYIEAQLGPANDAPRVKLVGNLTIDARNRIVTTLDDLPEVPVNEFLLTFRGGDQAAVVTPPRCGTGTGQLDATPFNKPTTPNTSTSEYTINTECDAVTGFAPTLSMALDNTAAGKSSPFTTTVSRPDRSLRFGSTQIALPPGVLATLKGVPECTTADATAGTCPAASKVGTVSSLAGVGPAPYSAPGEVFLTQRSEGFVAGLVFRVPVVFGEVNLGVLNVPAKIQIRPDDLGLTVFADVPQRFKGIPLNIRQLSIRLDRQGFPLSPTNCAPLSAVSTFTSETGTTAPVTAGLQATDCAKLGFTPEIDAAVSGSTGTGGHPLVQVRVQNPAGNSALRQTFVTLPNGLGFDLKQQARACSLEDFKATKCPDVAKIGKVSGALSITDEPLAGDLYLLKAVKGDPLPGIGLAFKGRFSGNVAGTNAIAKTGQLITQFETLPDLPLTSFQLDVFGGNGSVLLSTDKLCSASSIDFAATFVAHSGPKVDRKASTFCGSKLGALTPRIKATLSGVKKGKPSLVFSATAPLASTTVAAMKIKQIDVSLPSGYSLSTSRAKSSKGVAVKQLSVKGKSTTKRISARKLRVKLPAAGTTKAKILSRTGTITIASASKRRSKAKVAITLTFTYTNGAKTSVPVRLTPR